MVRTATVAVILLMVLGLCGSTNVPILDDIGPGGSYRICTANAGENICTPINIVGS